MQNSIDIYHSNTYRDYVKERLRASEWSLNEFSTKVGLSPSLAKMIFSGKRKLQSSHLHRIAHIFKLKDLDYEYFEALVMRDDADEDFEKRFYQRRLTRIKKKNQITPTKNTSSKAVASSYLLQDWKTPAMLIYLKDFVKAEDLNQLNPEETKRIADKLQITSDQLLKFLKTCQENGILVQGEDHNVHFHFERLSNVLHRKNYLSSLLQEIQKRYDKDWDNPLTGFEANTFTIAADQIDELKSEYRKLLARYVTQVPETSDKKVLQTFLYLFPVAKD